MISEQTIQQAVARLVAAAKPNKIILFGSYARGDATEDSDLDLMVIEQDVQNLLQPTDAVTDWYRAARALDSAAATPPLIAVLADEKESDSRRRLAALMLGMLGDARAIPALVSAMQAKDYVLRGRAAEMLGSFPLLENSIVARLLTGLSDPDRYFRECCAKALGQLKRKEALPQLEHMRDNDPSLSNREAAQEAIRSIQGGR